MVAALDMAGFAAGALRVFGFVVIGIPLHGLVTSSWGLPSVTFNRNHR